MQTHLKALLLKWPQPALQHQTRQVVLVVQLSVVSLNVSRLSSQHAADFETNSIPAKQERNSYFCIFIDIYTCGYENIKTPFLSSLIYATSFIEPKQSFSNPCLFLRYFLYLLHFFLFHILEAFLTFTSLREMLDNCLE